MFAFMHPYQTIRRLKREIADLHVQLALKKSTHDCRPISLMSPIESISMLQAKGADMLSSLSTGVEHHAEQLATERAALTGIFNRLHDAEKTVHELKHHRQRLKQADVHYTTPPAGEQALHELRKLSIDLEHSAGHARALAMSAAIEAAHHHEQPSGMSAIVHDMQHLAEQTQQMSHQLHHWVEETTSHFKEVARVQGHQHEAASALISSAERAELVIEQLIDQARHMYKVIYHSTTTASLHAAKLEHAVWKSRVYHQLLSTNQDEHLEDHQHCTFGCWYFSGEGQHYKHTRAYRALAVPHRQFHQSGLDALRCARQGDHIGQLATLALMEEASVEMAKQLDQLMEHAVYEIPLSSSHPSSLTDTP